MRWHVCFREPVASILHLFNSTGPRCTWISRHYVRACLRERERVRGKRHKLKKKKKTMTVKNLGEITLKYLIVYVETKL